MPTPLPAYMIGKQASPVRVDRNATSDEGNVLKYTVDGEKCSGTHRQSSAGLLSLPLDDVVESTLLRFARRPHMSCLPSFG